MKNWLNRYLKLIESFYLLTINSSPSFLSYADKEQDNIKHYPFNRDPNINSSFSLYYNNYHSHLQRRCHVVLYLSRLACEYYVAYYHVSVITSQIKARSHLHDWPKATGKCMKMWCNRYSFANHLADTFWCFLMLHTRTHALLYARLIFSWVKNLDCRKLSARLVFAVQMLCIRDSYAIICDTDARQTQYRC